MDEGVQRVWKERREQREFETNEGEETEWSQSGQPHGGAMCRSSPGRRSVNREHT
jgi:hypothetical protein